MEKRLLILSFFLLASFLTIAQTAPTIEWQVSLGGTGDDELDEGNSVFNNLILTNDGGYAFAGTSFSNDIDVTGHHGSLSTSDIWFVKLDSLGNLEWQKSLGGTGNERGNGLVQTTDGGYIIIGESWSNDGDVTGHNGSVDTMDVWVVKLDDQGNIQWQNSFGGTAYDTGVDIKETTDGGYIIGADTWSSNGDVSVNNGSIDFWFAKLDITGAIQWEKSFGGSSGDRLRSFQLTNNGGIIAIGLTTSDDGDITFNTNTFLPSIWVLKCDSIGNKEWDMCYGGVGFSLNQGTDIQLTPDGGYILNSYTTATNGNITCSNGGAESWVAKLDSTGSINWSACYGGMGSEFGKTIRQTPDGGYLISATTTEASGLVTNHIGLTDCWIVKTDSLGNIEWEGTYGGTNHEGLTTALPTPDGGYILGAQSLSNDGDVSGHHGALSENDVWIVKLSFTTGLTEPSENISGFALSPNPVSASAHLKFDLIESGHVEIDIFDISGRMVQKILDKNLNTGIHTIEINTEEFQLEKGIYLVRVSTTKSVYTIKMIKN